MAELSTIARPYAQGLMKALKDRNAGAEDVAQDLEVIEALASLTKNPEVATLVGDPKLTDDQLCDLIAELCGNNLPKEVVNGKRVDIPSYRVKAGDVVAVGEKFRDLLPIKEALISSERFEVPGWLEVDIEKLSGNVLALPTREQISGDINEQLIVELYSK